MESSSTVRAPSSSSARALDDSAPTLGPQARQPLVVLHAEQLLTTPTTPTQQDLSISDWKRWRSSNAAAADGQQPLQPHVGCCSGGAGIAVCQQLHDAAPELPGLPLVLRKQELAALDQAVSAADQQRQAALSLTAPPRKQVPQVLRFPAGGGTTTTNKNSSRATLQQQQQAGE
jgi:hypothetical protein